MEKIEQKIKKNLRRTESRTVDRSGGLMSAGCSASQAKVTPLSMLVGRNRIVELSKKNIALLFSLIITFCFIKNDGLCQPELLDVRPINIGQIRISKK